MTALKFLALIITLTASTPTKPELRREGGSSNYTAYNPLKTPITMNIACLGDYNGIDLPLPSRTSMQLEIKQPSGYAASCYMTGFVVKAASAP
jgi:hypothetical protein